MKKILFVLTAFCAAIGNGASAAEIGHYNGGILDIRDFFMPDPGLYGVVYNYYYNSDRLNNGNGDKINSLTVPTPGGPANVGLEVNIEMFATMPAIIWVSPWHILGAKYGGYIAEPFANNSLEANLFFAQRAGGFIHHSSMGVGDLFVQPVWLDWAEPHWDISLAYAFYAPVGRYNTTSVPLPGGANVTAGSLDNLGLGFWTQQVQGGLAWYPMTNKATAVTAALTYENNGKKKDFELRPGQMLTLNWGISQYLPLTHDHHLLLNVGPAGYDTWQITDSTGGDVIDPRSRSQVHGVGGEVGVAYVPLNAFATIHGFYEYASESRFQGWSIGLNLGIKF